MTDVDLTKDAAPGATVIRMPFLGDDDFPEPPVYLTDAVPHPATEPTPADAAPVLGGPDREDSEPRPVLEGVVIPAAERDLDDDPIGDLPWLPSWARTREGWRYQGRFARRQVRRAVRRWAHRQTTRNGHVPQFARGVRRAHDFVIGVEGVQVIALRHQAHIAAKEARVASRRARYAVMPAKKKQAQLEADRAVTTAQAAVGAYKKSKKDRSRARNLRASLVLGPSTAGFVAGGVMEGPLGLVLAGLATFAGGAVAGRHDPQEETTWERDFKVLGDGERLTDTMLNQVFAAAKVIGSDETLHMVRPAMRDVAAWCATFDLPPGIPARKAMRALEELASAFGVEAAQVHMDKAGRAGRLELWVSDELPFTAKPDPGPLLGMDGPTNFWGRIQIGPTVRGDRHTISVVERSGLVGGEPGAGKSASGNTILLAAALDPRVILWLADGKGGGDLEPFESLCEYFEGDADAEAFYEMLQEAIRDMKARYALLKKLGKRKVTEELANKYPLLRQKLLWVDELMFYTTDEEYGKKITKALRNLVSRGRAAGIITFCATQKPGSDVVDTSLRDLLSIRWALRCTTPEASDTILGKGAASAGYSAKQIEAEMRGAGFIWSEGQSPVLVRADYYDDDQVLALLQRARAYREAEGTLPQAEPTLADQLREKEGEDAQILAALVDVVDAYQAADDKADWLPGAELLDRLKSAGLDISAERLGALVVRDDDAKKKRTWDGSRVAGYPFELIRQTAEKYVLTA
ncbi:FtsK/SpoIIIE domain-containing protein [Streptomyces olivoreticuli]